MKRKLTPFAIALAIAYLLLPSCRMGIGDRRDRNIQHALMAYLDSAPEFEYVGMSDTHDLDGDRLQAVVIYYVVDSTGNQTEHNARVTTNHDCTEILTWENLESTVLKDTKRKVNEKIQEKGINIDGSLIDTLLKLKNR
ncbi:MAG: hypothetical protein K2K98_09765 [Muribaculaceae bacterium]|nr:hypothetical protein [Muribaculaceae bacterium]